MGRRIVALIGAGLALFFTLRSGAAPESPAGDEEAAFPAWEDEVAPAGELYVQGRRVHGSTFRTTLPVAEVIARHRAVWKEASVDLVEQALPDGRLLSILDVPGGRHLVVAARSVAGGTEVLRGWSPLGTTPVQRRALPVPEGWVSMASVEDRLGGGVVRTETLLARTPLPEAEAALRALLLGQGFTETDELQFERDGERVDAAFRGDENGVAVQLRIHTRSGR